MIGKMIRRFWTHLLITFYDSYTIEGFERTNKKFELPADLSHLDTATKRQLTICNLFANQNLSILEIVRLLDSGLHQVVPALIDNGLIKERRRNRGKRGPESPKAGRNAPLSILPEDTNAKTEPTEPATAFSSEEVSGKEAVPGLVNLSPSNRRMAS